MDTLNVSGRFLRDRQGNKIILRGVNYPLLDDWNFPKGDYLPEIVQSGANAVRIQWYIDYHNASRPPYTIADLGNFIDACRRAGIVPIVMLADFTCDGDPTHVYRELTPWWTSAAVMSVLKPREACLILNLANELGAYRWKDDRPSALNDYFGAYSRAIGEMRRAGYRLPLMIDAPDCGTTLDAFTAVRAGSDVCVGAELIACDTLANTMLSAHAYWAGYDGIPHVAEALAKNLPIIFGEIANKQDETAHDGSTAFCYYDLDGAGEGHPAAHDFSYRKLLTSSLSDEIGWLAWCWTKDQCAKRQMSRDGSASTLTAYGDDIVNNAIYGLKKTAVRVAHLP